MDRRYQIIDVFTDRPLAGNPLALVIDAEGLAGDTMQRYAAWTRLAETAFLLPPTTDEADYRVRIFTPDRELPFAGHPTLGSARGWLEAGGSVRADGTVVQECGVGSVTVRHRPDTLAFAAPPLIRDEDVDPGELERLVALVGLTTDDVVAARWADNGPGWAVLLLSSARAVVAACPVAWSDTPFNLGLVGPYDDEGRSRTGADLEVRAIHTVGGVVEEDPVTGSLNAGIAQWLLASGRRSGGWVAAQGRCVGRDGRIRIEPDGDRIWVGGSTRVLVTGTLDL